MGSLAAWLSAETSSIEFLRPVSIQGQTVLSCISFVPLSLGAIVLAAFARSLLNGVACAASDSFCISANGIPVSPTSLGALKVRERALHATPWIAVTGSSAHTGWDHPLYYDIITTGGLPYVLDLEICPQYSLHAMPKSLLAQVRESPLLPAAADVRRIHARAITTGPTATNESLPAHALPKESYKDRRSGSTGTAVRLSLRSGTAAETQQLVRLQRELYAHAAQHLTTAASARRLAERMLGEQQLDSFRPLRGGWRPRAVQAGGGGLYAAVAGGANASTARRAALASPKLRVLQLLAGSPSVQMTMLRYASWCCSCPTVAHSAVTVSVTVALPIPSHPRHGFEGLGAEVDERRDKRVRARRTNSGSEPEHRRSLP